MSDDILKLVHDKVEKLDSKFDSMASDIVEIKVTAARHDENLKVHMKRSDTMEQIYVHLKENDLKNIHKDINQLKGVYKFLLGIAGLSGILGLFFKFFSK